MKQSTVTVDELTRELNERLRELEEVDGLLNQRITAIEEHLERFKRDDAGFWEWRRDPKP